MRKRADIDDLLGRFASVLWSVRDSLDVLVDRLRMQRVILDAGMLSLLSRSDVDVQDALTWLRTAEVVRCALHEELAGELRLPITVSVMQLGQPTPEPWPRLLAEHHIALDALMTRAEGIANANARRLARMPHAPATTAALRTVQGVSQLSLHAALT
jgi:hypothetical protein